MPELLLFQKMKSKKGNKSKKKKPELLLFQKMNDLN